MNRISKLCTMGLVLALVGGTLVSVAQAESVTQRRPLQRRGPALFEVGGPYTGVVAGRVLINGVAYPMDPKAPVFQIGVGLVSIDQLPIGTMVHAIGTGDPRSGTVMGLIGRPPGEGGGRSEPSANVFERKGSLPE